MVMLKVFGNVQTLFLPLNSIGGVLGEIDCVNYTKFVIGDAPYFTFYHQDYPRAIGQICHIAYCVSMIYIRIGRVQLQNPNLFYFSDRCIDIFVRKPWSEFA